MNANHPLASWIDERMSDAEFARRCGISKSHLSLLLQGKRGISFDLATKIEEVTGGDFTAARVQQDQKAITDRAQAEASHQ